MDADRFARLEAGFQHAAALSPTERESWLNDTCDPDLVAELRRLLAAHDDEQDDPARAAMARAMEETPAGITGRVIGGYRVLEEIGRGGMGTVYEAERVDADFEQRVAIKLLRLGLRDPVSLGRFRRERQTLARLSHPNIARLIDGGTAEDGTPWVVMDLVQGQPLTAWAEQQGLSLKQRVELFVTLCRAIAYAHRNLVVHRDLKPENVIVDASGRPRVLDFGIAKLLDEEDEGTVTQARAFTPTYASPEQVLGEPITFACDVYSLGVMLYELCTGELPYDVEPGRRTDLMRAVCESPPVRPGLRSRAVRGDLEQILLKALRKDPARRYGTAAELAEDLRRYLESRPVEARPDQLGYRLRMYVRRHPVGVSASAAIGVLLVAFVANTLVQSARVESERDRAVREAEIARETTDFLVDLFQAPDPKEMGQRDLTAADLLDRGAARIDELGAEPLVRARLLHVIGLAQANLGRYDVGIDLLEQALTIREAVTGIDSAAVADSHNRLGNILRAAGRYREAEPHLVAALQHRLRSGEGDSLELADSHNNVGLLQSDLGHYDDAARNLEAAIAMHRRISGESTAVAVAHHNLALVRLGQARPEEAIALLEEGLAIKRRAGLAERATMANSQAVLARALLAEGRLEEALQVASASLELRQRILPEDHPHRASGNATLGEVLAALGQFEASAAAYDRSVSIAEAAYGGDAWRTTRFRADRARLLEWAGQSAFEIYTATLEAARKQFEAGSLHIATAAVDLARITLVQPSARALLEEASEIRRELDPGHPDRQEVAALLAASAGEPAVLSATLEEDPRLRFRLLRRAVGAGDVGSDEPNERP